MPHSLTNRLRTPRIDFTQNPWSIWLMHALYFFCNWFLVLGNLLSQATRLNKRRRLLIRFLLPPSHWANFLSPRILAPHCTSKTESRKQHSRKGLRSSLPETGGAHFLLLSPLHRTHSMRTSATFRQRTWNRKNGHSRYMLTSSIAPPWRDLFNVSHHAHLIWAFFYRQIQEFRGGGIF